MKKTFTLLFALTSILAGFSQGIFIMDLNNNVITETVVHVQLLPSSTVFYTVKLGNTENTADSIKAKRSILTMDASDSTSFCWGGVCYTTATTIATHIDTISTGNIVDYSTGGPGFHSTFYAGPATIVRKVHYIFYDIYNPADSAGFTIQYDHTATGIDEQNTTGVISEAYPNPASSTVSLNYNTNSLSTAKAKINIYDMLGKEVKGIALTAQQGTVKINTDDLYAGIYFYSLVMDDKIIATKKLVITK